MKKFLFTLAALCTFGLACAEPAPVMGFRNADNEQITEITLAPGETQELKIAIMEMSMNMVSGVQAQWRMFDAQHERIDYAITNKANPKKAYGPAFAAQWFDAIEYGTADVGMPGLAIGKATPSQNIYRILATNTEYNMCFFKIDPFDGVTERCPQNIGKFTMAASTEWDEPFATFELDLAYTLWNQCPGMDPNIFEEAWNTEPMILTVKNANYQEETIAAPAINFSEVGDVLTVTVTAEEGCTLIVNGQEIDSNTYSWTVDRTYEQQVINVAATAVKDGKTSDEATDSYTLAPKQKATVAAPVISYETTATQVIVTVAWPETDGDQVYTGQYTYDRPAYGQPDESYDVEAYTLEGATCLASPKAEATIPVPAMDPQWVDVAAPVISYETTATQVIVTIAWPTTTGDQVYTGQYTYNRPAYGEADESYDVEAYTTANYPYNESAHGTATIPVPAQDPQWIPVAAPVIIPTTTDDAVNVVINWPTTTGNQVYTGEYTYTRTDVEQTFQVEAYTEADYPYEESQHAIVTIVVPAKEQTPPVTEVGAPTFQGYTQDGITGYGVYILPTTEGSQMMYRVFVWDAETNDWNPTPIVDWTLYQGTVGEIYYTNIGGKYRVEAYAFIGDVQSTQVSYEFVVQDVTGIDEMMAGKTVANVRYYNMAGQEMQEANGVTIVVTTYTDGTTSAAKVIK